MRFVEPFKHKADLTDEQKLEAERLMFMELTQSKSIISEMKANDSLLCSLPMG